MSGNLLIIYALNYQLQIFTKIFDENMTFFCRLFKPKPFIRTTSFI